MLERGPLDYATLHDERMWSLLVPIVGHFSQFVRLCGEAVRDAPSRAWWSGFEKRSSNERGQHEGNRGANAPGGSMRAPPDSKRLSASHCS